MDQETRVMTEEKSARRFLFETSFDADPEVDAQTEQEEELPPEPTFSQEELDAARQDGYRDGHDAGMVAALDSVEAATAAHLESIWSLLPRIEQAQTAAHEKLSRDGVSLATAVTAKILPTLAMRHGTDEIEALVIDCLSRLVEEPKITVLVGPDAGAALAEKLDELVEKSGFEGRFIVRTEAEMGPADCRLEWGDGTAARNLDAVWSEIDAAVTRYLEIEADGPAADATGDDGPDGENEGPSSAAVPDDETVSPVELEAEAEPESEAPPETEAEAETEAETEADVETNPAAGLDEGGAEIEPST
ncbi:MAG: FliH/SctL family protein [Alphaproteobacteria bacterium]|nr:FliH/SctL family protein [Alphaproteobacteria bacterium]